jgi:hypothetical protein
VCMESVRILYTLCSCESGISRYGVHINRRRKHSGLRQLQQEA